MPKPITFEPKQVSEKVDLTFDFAPAMAQDETIASIASVTPTNLEEVGGSSNLTISGETISGQTVHALAAGGTHLERYLITVKIVTSRPQDLECEAYLPVRNKP